MTRPRAHVSRRIYGAVLVLFALAAGYWIFRKNVRPASQLGTAPPAATTPATVETDPASGSHAAPDSGQGFLYGRITTVEGATFEGRLRWGRVEEGSWSDFFNGSKLRNSWLARVPVEQRPRERRPIVLFGIEIAKREKISEVVRPFQARFGDITRIEGRGREVRVSLKSGTVVDLDRFGASDFDDGVRVWDRQRGVVDLDSLRIRSIDLLATPRLDPAPTRLHGTVRTTQGDFTGFIGWNRAEHLGSDELEGRTAAGRLRLRFDSLRSIARRPRDSSLVTQIDGSEVVLSGTAEVGDDNRGVYVADRRYGQVLISWEAFERLDFSDAAGAGTGPAYGDFPAGSPLAGTVTTRNGRRLTGRLVYDLDESETTDTLDASARGVHYAVPLGLVAALARTGSTASAVRVTLHGGEVLELEPTGDLGDGNAGMLIFVAGSEPPEYVRWSDLSQVDIDRPAAMYPAFGEAQPGRGEPRS